MDREIIQGRLSGTMCPLRAPRL